MVPTLLFVGVIAAAVGYRRIVVLAGVGVLVALIWGVGVSDGDLGVLAGGAVLAFVNYVVGAAVGTGVRTLLSAVRASAQPQPDP